MPEGAGPLLWHKSLPLWDVLSAAHGERESPCAEGLAKTRDLLFSGKVGNLNMTLQQKRQYS